MTTRPAPARLTAVLLTALLLVVVPWAGRASACPDDDGASGASRGPPQQPGLLDGYAATINGRGGLGCKVAGVDYRVGLALDSALRDPAAGGLPPGCRLTGNIVACGADHTTLEGWDFGQHGGMQLVVASGVSGTAILRNRFAVGANCLAPIRLLGPAGSTVISHNSINGGGGACRALRDGLNADIVAQWARPSAVVIFEWNEHVNIGEDAVAFTGAADGTMTVRERFNFIAMQGWRGHPDGIQLARGRFANSMLAHNTYWNRPHPGGEAGTQPFHIEAQLNSAIRDWTVAYNTLVLPGTCHGGRAWPAGCVVNFAIACKQDGSDDLNAGFRAYGNYVDASGAIAPLLTSGCVATRWGEPHQNRDMTNGGILAVRR